MKKIFIILLIIFTIGCQKENKDEIERIEKAINNPSTYSK